MAGEHQQLIAILNQAVSLEYTAAVQYNQHSILLTGKDRRLFQDLFKEHSQESMAHAKLWGERIVYLGGVPTVEIGTIQQSTDLQEMLEMDLELEKRAVEVYSQAHKVCQHQPTLFMLENQIVDEDQDVEELQKLLRRVAIAQDAQMVDKKAAQGGGR